MKNCERQNESRSRVEVSRGGNITVTEFGSLFRMLGCKVKPASEQKEV
jgi:hypothetical protein